jgi:hypothetical protein
MPRIQASTLLPHQQIWWVEKLVIREVGIMADVLSFEQRWPRNT